MSAFDIFFRVTVIATCFIVAYTCGRIGAWLDHNP